MPIMAFPFPFGDTLMGHAKYRGGGGRVEFILHGGKIESNTLRLALNYTILKDEFYLSITESHERNAPGDL